MLRHAAAAGTALAAGPWLVSDAFSLSGELSVLHWADQLKDPILKSFTDKTGIKIKAVGFSTEKDLIEKVKSTRGEGFDLCQPALDHASQWREDGLLAPLDFGRLPNAKNLVPSLLAASTELWQGAGEQFHVPHCWGSEAIAWRTDRTTIVYDKLSYGTLWEEQYRGAVQGRAHSLLLGIGLWMDAAGRLPSNRMLDAFRDEETFKRIYDEIVTFAIERKPFLKQFWDSPGSIKTGFTEGGCVIGQAWDGPVLELRNEGKPIGFMAPAEGAITWSDGWSMTSAARNVDQVYEFLNFLMTAETSAAVAATSGYNPVVAGAAALLSEPARTNFLDAYPNDALQKLWHVRPEPSWFKSMRVRYAEKLRAA